MDVYEEVCGRCLDDLYRIAYLTLGDVEKAAQTVEAVCTTVVRTCRSCTDAQEIRIRLVIELYRRCKAQLPAATAVDALPPGLYSLSSLDRLLLAIRTASGLTAAELAPIVGDAGT